MKETKNIYKIRVAEVEFEDDDGYDVEGFIVVDEDDTEESIEHHLAYDCGYIGVWVKFIEHVMAPKQYEKYDFISLDDYDTFDQLYAED